MTIVYDYDVFGWQEYGGLEISFTGMAFAILLFVGSGCLVRDKLTLSNLAPPRS